MFSRGRDASGYTGGHLAPILLLPVEQALGHPAGVD